MSNSFVSLDLETQGLKTLSMRIQKFSEYGCTSSI